MELLKAQGIEKSFGSLHVLKGIDLKVTEGQVISIIGPSGSGKSTLLRILTQLETADSGSIDVCGETMLRTENGKAVYAPADALHSIILKIGLVFQNFQLFPHWSVLRNIMDAPIKILGQPQAQAKEHALSLLAQMNLSEKAASYPCELSGGQQQRVAIARALALEPRILFFDEPTSALDPELTGEILKVIRELAAKHTTMVIVTHEMAFAKDVADHVIFMDGGVIVEEGSPTEVFENTQNERTQSFLSRYSNSSTS